MYPRNFDLDFKANLLIIVKFVTTININVCMYEYSYDLIFCFKTSSSHIFLPTDTSQNIKKKIFNIIPHHLQITVF